MKSVAVYCDSCAELSLAINVIEEGIPCFINWHPVTIGDVEDLILVEVTCREEDTAYVEKMLAPFV